MHRPQANTNDQFEIIDCSTDIKLKSALFRKETISMNTPNIGRIVGLTLLSACVLVSGAVVIFAQETVPELPPSNAPLETNFPLLSINGFLNASYFYDMRSDNNTFGFDQAEVDLGHRLGEHGSARVDFEWCSDNQGGGEFDIEQAMITLTAPIQNNLAFTFGKFNSPIGLEAFDPPDMYQYSYGLVSGYALPGNFTGLNISASLSRSTELCAFLANGWDNNFDFDDHKTFGGCLNHSFGGVVDFALGAISGSESDSLQDIVTVVDGSANVSLKRFLFGLEVNHGWQKKAGENFGWFGILAMTHIRLASWLGLTGRYDYFDDADAIRLESSLPEKRRAFTLAPMFSLGEGMTAIIEFRRDISNQRIFLDSDSLAHKSASSIAFGITYGF